jgi:hypothetical protein
VRSVRETVETARALEDLPEVAVAAFEGRLSDEQLGPVARLADASSDAEWARRAPNTAPADLARLARSQVTPTMDEARARRAARELGFWWRTDAGMLDGRFSLPDLDGALVERVFTHMIDQMKPAKGQPWETRARRGADALVQLCRNYADDHAVATPNLVMVVEVPQHGPATIASIPVPDEMVQALRAQAKIEPILVDDHGMPVETGKARAPLSAKTLRAVRVRDAHCRWPGCDRRAGLPVNHLWPVSWGGTDERANLAAVCSGGGTDHHGQLARPVPVVGQPEPAPRLAPRAPRRPARPGGACCSGGRSTRSGLTYARTCNSCHVSERRARACKLENVAQRGA